MEKGTIISPIGEGIENLFVAISEIHLERLILVATPKDASGIANIRKELAKFRYTISEKLVDQLNYESFVALAAELQDLYPNTYINIATGSPVVQHAAIVASLINGIPSLAASGGKAMILPVMRLSYYKNVSTKKVEILKTLKKNTVMNISDISRTSRMSLPLVSYHINGTLKCEGLRQMGLVRYSNRNIEVTPLGELMLRGYVAN